MRTSWIFLFPTLVVTLAAFTFVRDGATDAASTSEKWFTPATSTAKKNPIAPTQDSIVAGQKLYLKHCATCHGNSGNGDGPGVADLDIQPSKLCDPRLRAEPDGALFWKITAGKKPMPGYGRRLSETDRWNLINYIRTLAKGSTEIANK
jgi:mono/diheme cytochrome c family protein